MRALRRIRPVNILGEFGNNCITSPLFRERFLAALSGAVFFVRDSGFGIRDSGFGIRDSGFDAIE